MKFKALALADWGDMGLLGPDRQWFAAHGVTTSIGLHHAKRYPFYMNRLYIRCIGRKIRAMLNGRHAVDFEKMIEATGSGVVKYRGPLAIESAGAPLSFRNVYLRNR